MSKGTQIRIVWIVFLSKRANAPKSEVAAQIVGVVVLVSLDSPWIQPRGDVDPGRPEPDATGPGEFHILAVL